MARRNRSNQLEMNFDGLADSVTNLVGALILLVVLVIGLTRDAVSQVEATAAEARAESDAADKPMLPLKQRIALLETQVNEVETSIEGLNGRLQPLKQEIEELLEKLEAAQPPPKEKPAEPPERVTREVPFRPPFEKLELSRTSVGFVVEEKRVSFLDYREIGKLVSEAQNRKAGVSPLAADLPESDFRVEGKVGGEIFDLQVLRHAGASGEPLEEALQANSRFRRTLAALDPRQVVLEFVVYPDSFEPFRKLREVAWENNFDLGWGPQEAGQTIKLGRGAGSVQ